MKTKIWQTKTGYTIHNLIGNFFNVYLISFDNKYVLVDTGKRSNFKQLKRSLYQILPKGKNVDILVLTHLHYDHCQNAHILKQEYGCPIISSKQEFQYSSLGYTPLPKGTLIFTKILSWLGSHFNSKMFGFTPFNPDIVVNEHFSLLEQGLDIKIISTPGHSAGSISLVVDNDIALVGDAMFGIFNNSIYPPFAADITEMKKSWKKLYDTGCRLFLPGHGNAIKRDIVGKIL